ncbi:Adipocyte plasma membrane-associated protein [Orchesella cincta]|uniref:Adipocyte plasma membrane-associated protein n=1 Tax=Orchesella cincta TaxID=48709 RepID=A0A1D2N890_ORCCI|nr:Adipocyte plasma membrane-associated protein [Orchesella cincta]
MGVVKYSFRLLGLASVATMILLFVPGIPPHIDLKPFHIEPPKELKGWFASNNILDQAELYYEGPNPGMESVVVLDDNNIITGDQSGAIFKITGKQTAVNITRLKYPCSTALYGGGSGETCGWPLGMRLDNDGKLMVMDFFGGMAKVNLKTGSYETIIPKDARIDGKVGETHEDVDIAKDGTIYWTDGSTNGNFFDEMMSQPSGRLIRYDPISKTNEVLLDDLHFSNGLCLSDNDEFVLVSEMGSASVRRYFISGTKKGESDTFINGLPGYPDNIRPNGRGGFYVMLFSPWNEQYSMRTHLFSPYPILRKLILRTRYLLLEAIGQVKTIFPDNSYLNDIEKYITIFGPIINSLGAPRIATVVEVSKDGEIIGVFYGKNGSIHSLSQITVGTNYAYLVSPFNNKVWRIKLDLLRKRA